MLELLQTILKTSRLCIPTCCWINCKILYHLTIVLSCSKNCFQHVGVQLVIDEQLHKLYLLCFLFVSDLLELLQTILKITEQKYRTKTQKY